MWNSRRIIRWMSASHVATYRLTGGHIGGHVGKAPVLLLTTTGRTSGVERTTPLIYVRDGDRVALVASNAGDDKDPNWWQNLKKQPRAKVQIGSEAFPVTARQARPDEQARLWPQFLSVYRTYDDYQKRTSRPIPVVILDRL